MTTEIESAILSAETVEPESCITDCIRLAGLNDIYESGLGANLIAFAKLLETNITNRFSANIEKQKLGEDEWMHNQFAALSMQVLKADMSNTTSRHEIARLAFDQADAMMSEKKARTRR